ncbi:class I SAM-dependent methyltransferase [Pseudomonas sp.]|uniref:class I SAM-dependent methyltransferase n=1 Tax=Pseudomonas sp. TaxID=306 RepID=UPI003981C523
MSDNHVSRLFGARADAYASFRPHYPASLFAWLAAQCPERLRALDIACGNGQASRPLREYFKQVLACDASLEQLHAGADQPGLQLFVAEAQAQPLPSQSLDLIVVAQALHWFATPEFFSEVRRLLKPGGVFCAWCYSLMRIDEELDALIDDFYWNTLGGYWPAGRASVDAGYRDINNPFAPLIPPASAIEISWTLEQLLGYLRTWSAVQRYEQQNGADPLLQLQPKLRQVWRDAKQPRFVRWPLHFLAGTPN